MNAKDWIEFAKEKPKHGQVILVQYHDGISQKLTWRGIVERPAIIYWQPWADPEKPDPFEAWQSSCLELGACHGACEYDVDDLKMAWNAALEWRRQNPESEAGTRLKCENPEGM